MLFDFDRLACICWFFWDIFAHLFFTCERYVQLYLSKFFFSENFGNFGGWFAMTWLWSLSSIFSKVSVPISWFRSFLSEFVLISFSPYVSGVCFTAFFAWTIQKLKCWEKENLVKWSRRIFTSKIKDAKPNVHVYDLSSVADLEQGQPTKMGDDGP